MADPQPLLPAARVGVEIPRSSTYYPVFIGDGLGEMRRNVIGAIRGDCIVITDQSVSATHGETVKAELNPIRVITLPAAGHIKRLETIVDLIRAAARDGLDRRGAFVALGGGTVTDIAGLAASLFMRGIDVFHLPTTLLGAVDAAVGGKTAVDLPEGKNLLGTFHHPTAVVCDVSFLESLSDEQWKFGLAEVIKTAIIADPDLLDTLEATSLPKLRKSKPMTIDVIRRSVSVKAQLVKMDEEDRNERMKLNCGHTIAHALETASDYRIAHGAAVAIGLTTEAVLAERLGIADLGEFGEAGELLSHRLDRLFSKYWIPSRIPSELVDRALEAIKFDKKRELGKIRFALPVAPGDVQIVSDVTPPMLTEVIRSRVTA
jgi:3-dehydroquinate synthase